MAQVTPVFNTIRGMATDPPFDQLQPGFVRRVLNALPGRGLAPVQVRAGWGYGTPALPGAAIDWLVWAPFPGAEKVVTYSLTDLGSDYVTKLDGATAGTAIGATSLACSTAPFFHRTPTGGLVIYPAGGFAPGPTTPVRKWTGSGALADLAGSPPAATRGASWGDYLILAGDTAAGRPHANRAWFSAVGNPESWDLVNGYADMPEDIVAIIPRGNSIFFFGAKGTHIMVGDQPPPGGNMTLKKYAFSQGLSDPDAVATYKDFVLWGNANGIFRSDGSQPSDITSIGGISSYWPFCYSPVAGDYLQLGCYRQYLLVVVLDSSKAFKSCLIFDLEANTWWEWSNIVAPHLLRIPSWSGATEDLLFPVGNRIVRVAPVFGGVSDTDGDGSTPQLTIITGGLRLGMMGEKRLRRSWLTFTGKPATVIQAYASVDLALSPSSNPAADPPNLFSIGSPTPSVLNQVVRVPLRVHRKAELIRFKIQGQNAVRLYGLEQEIAGYAEVRDGDPHA